MHDAPIRRAAVLEILRTPAASDTFPDMIARVEALEGCGASLEDAYALGFEASGEGWNGEYPTADFRDDPVWQSYRDKNLAALEPVAQPETPTPGQFTTMCLAIEDVITGRGFDADPWRSIKDDPPPLGEDVLGFWQYMYPGDKSRTCGYEVGEVRADGTFVDHEGQHATTLFTHWQPLNPPGETTSAIPEAVKAYLRNALMVGGWKGE